MHVHAGALTEGSYFWDYRDDGATDLTRRCSGQAAVRDFAGARETRRRVRHSRDPQVP